MLKRVLAVAAVLALAASSAAAQAGNAANPIVIKMKRGTDSVRLIGVLRQMKAAGKGVIVQDVKPGSFAEDINLGRGDVILEVNKQPVNNEQDFARVEAGLKSGQDVVFLVRPRGSSRQDGTIFVAGTLP